MNTTYIRNLILSFGSIILIIVVGVLYNLTTIDKIYDEATELYKHPYVINNAVRDININLVSMHRYMKDVALARNEKEILLATNKVSQNENNIFQLLPILHDKYLGEQKEISAFERDFRNWKEIRLEVIFLTRQNKNEEASKITQEKGAKHLQLIIDDLEKITLFADAKGNTLISEMKKEKRNTTQTTIVLSLIALLIAISISYYILRDTRNKEKKIRRYFHMIDHNIFSLVFDKDGNIVESSSALAFFLKKTREELYKQNIDTLIRDKEQLSLMMLSLKDGFTWKNELYYEEDVYFKVKVAPSQINDTKILYSMILYDISDKKRIERLSFTDPLTGLSNRRYFDTVVTKELQYMARVQENTVFVMIDIDHFKLYNDHYGHPEGDVTLKAVANELKKHLRRPHDYAFRLGGEEFGLLFSAEPFEEVKLYLEDLIKSIEALKIRHALSTTSEYVTISAGAVYIEKSKTTDIEYIYQAADKLLYKAKDEGRNQLRLDVL